MSLPELAESFNDDSNSIIIIIHKYPVSDYYQNFPFHTVINMIHKKSVKFPYL